MSLKPVIELLKKYKDAPELGGGFDDEAHERSWKRVCDHLGFEYLPPEQRGTYPHSLRDYAQYVSYRFSKLMVRPLAVGMSVFLVTFGSWIATVNASFESVPGDVLYPVKLVTERVQLSLALSEEQRARLHLEFASRRLEEVANISVTDVGQKDERIKTAVESFKNELAQVNLQMETMQKEHPSQAASVAVAVDQKQNEYTAVIEQSAPVLPAASQVDLDEILSVVEDTGLKAVATLVETHAIVQEPIVAIVLEQKFFYRLGVFKNRLTLLRGRLATLESALDRLAWAGHWMKGAEQIQTAEVSLEAYASVIRQVESLAHAGEYQAAFERLGAIEGELGAWEEMVTPLEIEITTNLSTYIIEPEEADAAEEGQTSEEPVEIPEEASEPEEAEGADPVASPELVPAPAPVDPAPADASAVPTSAP